MNPARTNLRSALNRLMVTACAASLVAIALVAPRDAALAQSHIATPPAKRSMAISGPKPVLGVKATLAKPEREMKLSHKLEGCAAHGGCSGLIQSVGSPKPLRPFALSFPIESTSSIDSGGSIIHPF
jgi:hypothetical protein